MVPRNLPGFLQAPVFNQGNPCFESVDDATSNAPQLLLRSAADPNLVDYIASMYTN